MPSHGNEILQSTFLKTAAKLTAQVAQIWSHMAPQSGASAGYPWLKLQFCGVIQAEIGWHWHNFLEGTLPTSQPEPPNDYGTEKQKLQEQKQYWICIFFEAYAGPTAGLSTMNTVFIICTTAAQVSSVNTLEMELDERMWPLVLDAWRSGRRPLWSTFFGFQWIGASWSRLVWGSIGLSFCQYGRWRDGI
ncbi:hypothetical protein BDW75DRAFT_243199 [Aspergillus navahoensis]